jgi:uncharacterized protein YeaO (DUF488 family)
MAIAIVRLGTPRGREEGVRLGTVRRPPRGVPKGEFASRDYYDVWLPNLAPSMTVMQAGRAAFAPRASASRRVGSDAAWREFDRAFTAEMKKPDAARLLDALAALSHTANFAVGCYCADESRCHRSILRRELQRRGAAIR